VTEYSIVFVERVQQIDPETIEFKSFQWVSVIAPYPNASSYTSLPMFYAGLYGRLLEHFRTVEYPAPTGDECPDDMGGMYGDGA
jgi:adenine-specific DNA methylase